MVDDCMPGPRYVVLTLEHAHLIAAALARTGAHRGALGPGGSDLLTEDQSAALGLIYDRLNVEAGADMQEIVDILRGLEFCAACVVEGMRRHCHVLAAQKQGRRLRRLLERARGTRSTGTT